MTDSAAGEVRDGYDAWKALDAQERATAAPGGALDIDCPTCGERRGSVCVTFWRLAPRTPHPAREREARRA